MPGGESFAGITVPRGDPAELRSAASTLQGLAGAMQGVGGQLRALPAQLASWQGLAQLMFTASVLASSGTADQAMQAFETGGYVVASFADALERAQRQARKAVAEARDAQHRIDRAQGQIADARQRSHDAASRATTAAATVMATSLVGTPDVGAQAEQARADRDLAQAASDGRNAQRGLEVAQEDLRRAQREGHAAEQAARDAGHAAGQALWAIAGASPDHVAPGPPATPTTGGGPAPHPQPQHHSFWGGVWDTVKGGAKDVAGFAEDTAKGVGDFAVGVEHTGVMLAKLSPVYGLVDPAGQQQEMQQLGQGIVYAWHHPGDFGKALIDWNDIEHGHPGRAFGQLLPKHRPDGAKRRSRRRRQGGRRGQRAVGGEPAGARRPGAEGLGRGAGTGAGGAQHAPTRDRVRRQDCRGRRLTNTQRLEASSAHGFRSCAP